MANTIIDVPVGPTNLTGLTLRLVGYDNDTIANSGGDDTLTERTNKLGSYTGTYTESTIGLLDVIVLSGDFVVWKGFVYVLTDNSAVYVAEDGTPSSNDKTPLDGSLLNSLVLTSGRVDVGKWVGFAVTISVSNSLPEIAVVDWADTAVTVSSSNALPEIAVVDWADTPVTISSTSALPQVDVESINDSNLAAAGAQVIYESAITYGSVNDVSTTTTAFTVAMDTVTPANSTLDGLVIVMTSGNQIGLSRGISSNNNTSGSDTDLHFDGASTSIDAAWETAPANTDTFVILGRYGA